MTMSDQPENLFEAKQPLDEAKLAANQPLVEAILNAEQSGPVMTPDEFREWLSRQ